MTRPGVSAVYETKRATSATTGVDQGGIVVVFPEGDILAGWKFSLWEPTPGRRDQWKLVWNTPGDETDVEGRYVEGEAAGFDVERVIIYGTAPIPHTAARARVAVALRRAVK